MHVVAKAAYRLLVSWVTSGELPPIAPRLELVAGSASPTLARDPDGIAIGGIRTPPVDVPVDVLTGEPGPGGDVVRSVEGRGEKSGAVRVDSGVSRIIKNKNTKQTKSLQSNN